MPRPAESGVTPVSAQGFGPSATPTGNIGVYAPLDVQGAPSQAALLAKSLGVFNEEEQTTLRRDARMQGAADVGQGESAAETSSIDPALIAKNEGYAVGAQRVSAQKSGIAAIAAVKQQMETDPKFTNLSPQAASQAADSLLRSQLGGLESDPVTAKAILPMVQAFHNDLLSSRTEQSIKNTQSAAIDNATTLATAEAAAPGRGLFNYGDQLETLKGLYGGNGVVAQQNLSQALIDKAVANHDTRLLGLITPPPGAPGLAPALQLKISEATQRINILQRDDADQWNKQAQPPIMDAVLKGHDPTAMLHDYLGHPGADARFAQEAMGFYHSLSTEKATDQLDTGSAAKVVSDVAGGNITTAAQALSAVTASGVTGKAKTQLLDRALSTLRSVQSTDVDDPAMRAAVSHLQALYRPGQNSLTGQIQNPAQLNQQTGIILDFRTEYAKAIKNGASAEQAASQTLQSVQKKWGDPLEQGNNFKNRKLPVNDVDQASDIRAAVTDSAHFRQSGVRTPDIDRLHGLGMVTDQEAAAAYRAILQLHHQ